MKKIIILIALPIIIAAFFVFIWAQTNTKNSNNSELTLQSGFKNPPVSARPKALWPWLNGNVNLSQITYEMEEAVRKGMGGFDIWDIGVSVDPNNNIPAGPAFLSDESVQAIAYAIREADRLGLELGLTFSSSWNAGGSWVKPEHGAMGLFRSDTIVVGPQKLSVQLKFPDVPKLYGNKETIRYVDAEGLPVYYKEVALVAHPFLNDSIISSSENIITLNNNQVTWDVPKGKWRIVRYVCVPTGQPLAIPSTNSKGLMLDHFSAEAQRANINYVFSRLLPVTGNLKNRSLKYLYADSYEVNSAVWTPTLPEAFQKRNGYSLEKYLPVLDGFQVASPDTSKRFMFDFTKTLSDLIIQNHYKLGTEICKENGLGFCAEAGGPGKPIHNVPFEDLKALGALTIPRGEFWNKHPQLDLLQIVKGISSAAHIYNQKYVEAESFTSVWLWQEGPNELKPLADRAMCEGLNRFVYHTFPHTPPDSGDPGWVYNFGTLINTTNGWWSKSKGFHNYLARCSYLLQQGNFVGDVAFYYGDEAPNFVAPKHIPATLGFGYDYDVVNSEVILEKMEAKDGKIFLPHGQYYEVLVLPDNKAINLKVLNKLEKLIAAGAVVIGPKPELSVGLANHLEDEKQVKTLADKLWGKADSIQIQENKYGKGKVVWGKTVRDVLLQKFIYPDVDVDQSVTTNIDYIHRRTEGEDIYFIRNTKDTPVSTMVQFRIKNKNPSLWLPDSGEIIPIPVFESNKEGIKLPLTLDEFESCFIVFGTSSEIKPVSNITLNGIALNQKANQQTAIYYSINGILTSTNGDWKWTKDKTSSSKKVDLPEPLVLNGQWEVRFDQSRGAPARDTMETLIPLNQSKNDRIKYYSGNVTYLYKFELDKDDLKKDYRVFLDMGQVKEIAEVYVNGINFGFVWHTPFQVDVTQALKEGQNNLIIEVVNTPNNRLVGDAKLPAHYQRTNSNVQRLPNAWMNPFTEAPLIDAGLIGPVKLKYLQVLN